MAELEEERLTVELEKTGETTDRIKSYRISSDYLVPSDEFEFVVFDEEDPVGLRRKFQPLQRVKLYINGQVQLIGRIDGTEGVGDSGASLRVHGRDFIGEIVDGDADPSVRFAEGTDLGSAILDIVRPFGIDTLVGSYNLTRNILTGKNVHTGQPAREFTAAKLSDYKIEADNGAFDAANKIVARHGFTIQSGGARNILAIVEPLFGLSPLYKLNKPGNVLRGTAKRDYADVPTVTIVTGRTKKQKLTGGEKLDAHLEAEAIAIATGSVEAEVPQHKLVPILLDVPSFGERAPNEIGRFPEVKRITGIDENVPEIFDARVDWKTGAPPSPHGILYKPHYYEDKESKTPEQLARALRRQLAERLKDTLVYSCTVRGHKDPVSGAMWSVDTVVEVFDEVEDVVENLWILSRTFSNDGSGPKTELKLIRGGSIAL